MKLGSLEHHTAITQINPDTETRLCYFASAFSELAISTMAREVYYIKVCSISFIHLPDNAAIL
jgi:hypothetical protein